jgi:hypothetical protein
VVRDRGRPFSRKHRSTWLAVTGGMLLIGAINLVLGFLVWPSEARHPKPPLPITYDVPSFYTPDAGVDAPPAPDAAVPFEAPPTMK